MLSATRTTIRAYLDQSNFFLLIMSRRSPSPVPDERAAKRQKIAGLTPDDYRNGVMLAPMVRSGARTSSQLFFSQRCTYNFL